MANKNTRQKLKRRRKAEEHFHGKACVTDFRSRVQRDLPVTRSQPKNYGGKDS